MYLDFELDSYVAERRNLTKQLVLALKSEHPGNYIDSILMSLGTPSGKNCPYQGSASKRAMEHRGVTIAKAT